MAHLSIGIAGVIRLLKSRVGVVHVFVRTFKVAHNNFLLFFKTYRIRCDFSALEMYFFNGYAFF